MDAKRKRRRRKKSEYLNEEISIKQGVDRLSALRYSIVQLASLCGNDGGGGANNVTLVIRKQNQQHILADF